MMKPYQLPIKRKPKEPKKPRHLESAMQRACVEWFSYQYSPLAKLLFANANGGKRSKLEARIMQGEAVRAGIPDLTLAVARGEWHGLYIELKVPPNQPRPYQREMMELLTAQGYYCQVVYSKEQFIELITNYLKL